MIRDIFPLWGGIRIKFLQLYGKEEREGKGMRRERERVSIKAMKIKKEKEYERQTDRRNSA